MKLRIGSVPYLNAKPLVDWFHSPECDADVELIYAVPSQLARMLRAGELDVCNCSIFEGLQQPGLALVPNISISSDGPVKSVRLFCKTPLTQLQSVALDTSSLTSSALTRILLKEQFQLSPCFRHAAPNLERMLAENDAGLIIGDLKLFDLLPGTTVYDLGEGWKQLTGLPFVYAAWQTPLERTTEEMVQVLTAAKNWGVARLDSLAHKWSVQMDLPLQRCLDYFLNVMNYDLTPHQEEGLRLFQQKCLAYKLIDGLYPLPLLPSSSDHS